MLLLLSLSWLLLPQLTLPLPLLASLFIDVVIIVVVVVVVAPFTFALALLCFACLCHVYRVSVFFALPLPCSQGICVLPICLLHGGKHIHLKDITSSLVKSVIQAIQEDINTVFLGNVVILLDIGITLDPIRTTEVDFSPQALEDHCVETWVGRSRRWKFANKVSQLVFDDDIHLDNLGLERVVGDIQLHANLCSESFKG
ncbi:unnamed protein product, partial [Prunus brigantina]